MFGGKIPALPFGREIAKIGAAKIMAVALLAISLAAPQVAKPFVDTFAFGTSYGKVYAFSLFTLLLAFSGDLMKMAGKRVPKIGPKAVLALILILFLYGLFGQLSFVSSAGGQPNAKYYAFDANGYTSTQMNHIHALKTIFCPLGLNSEEFDCARPLLPYLPAFYPYLGALLALAALAAAAAFFPSLASNSDRAVFLILSFASLKAAIDGGVFNYENIAIFMLVPFLLARKNRLAFALIGIALWLPFTLFAYEFYEPVRLAAPLVIFLYPLGIMLYNPKQLFPLLLICLVAPTYVLAFSEVVKDRWQPEPCANAGANPNFGQMVSARLYAPCAVEKQFKCGSVSANGTNAAYWGQSLKKPELMLSKALAEGCSRGIFEIQASAGTVKVIKKG